MTQFRFYFMMKYNNHKFMQNRSCLSLFVWFFFILFGSQSSVGVPEIRITIEWLNKDLD